MYIPLPSHLVRQRACFFLPTGQVVNFNGICFYPYFSLRLLPLVSELRFVRLDQIYYCISEMVSGFHVQLMIHFEFCVNCEILGFPSCSSLTPPPRLCVSNCLLVLQCVLFSLTHWTVACQLLSSMGICLQVLGDCPASSGLSQGLDPQPAAPALPGRTLYHCPAWKPMHIQSLQHNWLKAPRLSFSLLHQNAFTLVTSLGHSCVGLFLGFLFLGFVLVMCVCPSASIKS